MKKLSKESDHFVVFYDQNSKAEKDIDEIVTDLEKAYKKIVRNLGLKPDERKIKFFLYEKREDKVRDTGEEANGHTNRKKFEIYAVYNKDATCVGPHEVVHLLVSHLGFSNYVLGEGLAESQEESWATRINGKRLVKTQDGWIRHFKKNNQFFPITTLFDDKEFVEVDCNISYPEAGSFVKFLLRKYDSEKVLEVFELLERRGDLHKNLEVFKDTIGKSVEEVEEEWLEFLG